MQMLSFTLCRMHVHRVLLYSTYATDKGYQSMSGLSNTNVSLAPVKCTVYMHAYILKI